VRYDNEEGVGNPDVSDDLRSWAASDVTDRDLVAAAQRCVEAQAGIPLNANPTLAIEAALLEVARRIKTPVGVPAN
jgi:hypothetical protein